jgi:hypothetical protein
MSSAWIIEAVKNRRNKYRKDMKLNGKIRKP